MNERGINRFLRRRALPKGVTRNADQRSRGNSLASVARIRRSLGA